MRPTRTVHAIEEQGPQEVSVPRAVLAYFTNPAPLGHALHRAQSDVNSVGPQLGDHPGATQRGPERLSQLLTQWRQANLVWRRSRAGPFVTDRLVILGRLHLLEAAEIHQGIEVLVPSQTALAAIPSEIEGLVQLCCDPLPLRFAGSDHTSVIACCSLVMGHAAQRQHLLPLSNRIHQAPIRSPSLHMVSIVLYTLGQEAVVPSARRDGRDAMQELPGHPGGHAEFQAQRILNVRSESRLVPD